MKTFRMVRNFKANNHGVERLSDFAALLQLALDQDRLSGLNKILEYISNYFNADGCILLELSHRSEGKETKPVGHLFTLARWFNEEENYTLHNLPLQESVTGIAVMTQETQNVPNVEADKRVYKKCAFWKKFSFQSFCSVPIRFTDGNQGALNLYSNSLNAFSPEQLELLDLIASFVPNLYEALRDRAMFDLIKEVSQILDEAEISSQQTLLSKEEMKDVIKRICQKVQESLQCLEVSVFLEDPLNRPGEYELMGTVWPREHNKLFYHATIKEGLTGWILARKRPVKIFDLSYFEEYKKSIQQEYPKIKWIDYLNLSSSVRQILELDVEPEPELQPLSFMGTPLMLGNEILGVIRCCTAIEGPYYFGQRELELLSFVATRLAQAWKNWINRRISEEENRAWKSLVEGMSKLNSYVLNKLDGKQQQEKQIFAEALRTISSTVPSTEIIDVRLIDREKNLLYFAETFGEAWEEGTYEERRKRKNRIFPLGGDPPCSAGSYVVQKGEIYVSNNVKKDPYYNGTFPETQRMIIAPILVGDEVLGVLDIRSLGELAFPKHAEIAFDLIGRQLGVYTHLASTITQLRRVQSEQIQTFQDFFHQLRSPLFQALLRIQDAVETSSYDQRISLGLYPISGLCSKANRVARNLGLFSDLARKKSIKLKVAKLELSSLIKLLIQIAMDSEVTVAPSRKINFDVERRSFNVLNSIDLELDRNLLEQAISNLLDNAAKYSFPHTKVRIFGGITRVGRFHITVMNKGISIRAAELKQCVQRNWRGAEAKLVTGEGYGIGLWIVENIMKTHDGELLIVPTTKENFTEIKLIFPI